MSTRKRPASRGDDGLDLDGQQVEILGRNFVKAALIEAGLEVATPERDVPPRARPLPHPWR